MILLLAKKTNKIPHFYREELETSPEGFSDTLNLIM
jgi:hypothetical protein